MHKWLLVLLIALMPLSSQSEPTRSAPGAGAHVAASERLRSSWGRRLNPAGNIPTHGFRAFYFSRDNPGQLVFAEDVGSVAIKYALSEFHQIVSERFAAYWVGRLRFETETVQQFSVSQSWSRSRIFIDGEIVFDENSRERTFTHVFAPGEHVIEVEYINNWHTVEFKVTIGDPVTPLSEPALTAWLENRRPRPTALYYVGLYESGSRYTGVNVTLPAGRRPVLLWLSSYEAIDWNIAALPRGSVVVISSHAPGSRARGPGIRDVLYVDRPWSVYTETRRCSCSGGGFRCDEDQDVDHVAERLGGVTGLRLSGYAMAYSTAAVTVQNYGEEATRRILAQRQATEAARRQCTRIIEPDFDTMMDPR